MKNVPTLFTNINLFGSCSSEKLKIFLIYSQAAGISPLHLYKTPLTYRCSHHSRKTAARNTKCRVIVIEDFPHEIVD